MSEAPHTSGAQPPPPNAEALRILTELAAPLQASIPGPAEVVVHHLPSLPHSIVAIAGNVTGREVGDPATNTLLEAAASQSLCTHVGYETTAPDGRALTSTTIIINTQDGSPIAALCINRDVTGIRYAERVLRELSTCTGVDTRTGVEQAPDDAPRGEHAAPTSTDQSPEAFVHSIDELASLLLRTAIPDQEEPGELSREQKIAAVRSLKKRGFFLLRDAAEKAATTLGVSRFTIYNYLNEIDDEHKPPEEQP